MRRVKKSVIGTPCCFEDGLYPINTGRAGALQAFSSASTMPVDNRGQWHMRRLERPIENLLWRAARWHHPGGLSAVGLKLGAFKGYHIGNNLTVNHHAEGVPRKEIKHPSAARVVQYTT